MSRAATVVLVCRYRPRGLRKEDEVWDVWAPDLGPSRALHAAYYGHDGPLSSLLAFVQHWKDWGPEGLFAVCKGV